MKSTPKDSLSVGKIKFCFPFDEVIYVQYLDVRIIGNTNGQLKSHVVGHRVLWHSWLSQ